MTEAEWCKFMEVRFVLAHKLLKDTGTILVHIDDRMLIELQSLLYTIFGKKNHIMNFIWKKRSSGANQSKFGCVEHEYILAFAKNIKKCVWNGIPQFDVKEKNISMQIQGGAAQGAADRPHQSYPIYIDAEFKQRDAYFRANQQYPLYIKHGSDPKDRVGSFSVDVATKSNSMPNQRYPLYVDANQYHKTGVKYDEDKDDFGIHGKILFQDTNPMIRDSETAKYPLYIKHGDEPKDKTIIFDNQSRANNNAVNQPNQHYPLYYSKQDGYQFGNTKPHFKIEQDETLGEYYNAPFFATDASAKSRPKNDDKYPLYTDTQTRISLTPFEGSTEVYPKLTSSGERGCWRAIPATCQKLINANMLVVKNGKIYQKQYAHFQFNKKTGKLEPFTRTNPIRSIILEPTNLKSNKEIKEIYGKSVFTYAKPVELIKKLINIISNEGDTILDLFAGSGTTGQACWETKRHFILIQLPENNIEQLTQERLDKKVGKNNYIIKGCNAK